MDHSPNAAMQPDSSQGSELAISDLMTALKSDKGRVRQLARERLCEIGSPAVPQLVQALDDRDDQVRWEAAKSLTQIPDPRAAETLVERLTDNFSIRWLASEALINMGQPAFVPLVRGLLAHPDSPRLREGAHHVLTGLKRAHPDDPYIAAMLKALIGPAVTETVPWVARDILAKLGHMPPL